MKKHFNFRSLFYLCCMLCLLGFDADSAQAQRRRQSIKKANWQFSVPPNLNRGKVTLGIRDKYGEMGSYNASFVVTSPKKKVFRTRMTTLEDEWAYADFPADFTGNMAESGTYSVVFYADGVIIGRGKFRFRP